MTAREILDGIISLGGDAGKTPSAAVNNGLKRHDELFVIRKEGKRNTFGLCEWEDRTDMQSMFEG